MTSALEVPSLFSPTRARGETLAASRPHKPGPRAVALFCAVLALLALVACGDQDDVLLVDARAADARPPVADDGGACVVCLPYEQRSTECKALCQVDGFPFVCAGAAVSDCVVECIACARGTSYCPLEGL